MRPPKLIKPYVLKFCRRVVNAAEPVYVPCEPLPQAPANACFPLVERQVAEAGGECVFGWAIWEWPKVFIEAEFHAVWRRPDGAQIDVAPKPLRIPRVLFLPDHHRVYRGRQVDNIRWPLSDDKHVARFCAVAALLFQELNPPGAYSHEVVFSEQCFRYAQELHRLRGTLQRRYGVNHPERLA